MNLASLVYIAVGILAAVGAELAYFGNPHPRFGVGGFAVPAVILTVGFLLRGRGRKR